MITRTFTSFLIVLATYGVYAVLAAPWVEPRIKRRSTAPNLDATSFRRDHVLEKYVKYLPSGSWELDNPRVLRTQGAIVLWQRNETLPDGSLELTPCTVIYDSAPNEEKKHDDRPLVMQAPDGARLRFDKPLVPRRIDIGKLVGGILNGPIHIRRPGATGDQRLEIETSNVRINEQRLWTPDAVRFQLGDHHGAGRDLLVQFLESEQSDGVASQLDFVELTHVERVTISVQQTGTFFGQTRTNRLPALIPSQQVKAKTHVPIYLTCDGPFRMSFADQLATLEENVRLRKPNDGLPDDQLLCDTLKLHFNQDAPQPGSADDSLKLQLKRIVAIGKPARVDAPSREAVIRAHRLEYDFDQRQFHLESPSKSIFRDANHHIETKQLDCQTNEAGDIVRLRADGAGRFAGMTAGDTRRRITASWSQQLSLQPANGHKLLSISGNADVQMEVGGTIEAERIDVWLDEYPSTEGKLQYRPNRVLARDNVRFSSPRLAGDTQRLEAWFAESELTRPSTDSAEMTGPTGPGVSQTGSIPKPQPNANSLFDQSSSDTRMHVSGELLKLRMTRRGDQVEPTDMALKGNARFAQYATDDRSLPLLDVQGDVIQVEGASETAGVVIVSGAPDVGPARVESERMTIEAAAIQLDRKANRMWIDGSGRMTLPMTKDLQGRPLARPQMIKVNWQDSMNFDGRAITLQGDVDARGTNQHLRTDWLQVVLAQRIDFQRPPKHSSDTEVLGFAADRGVNLRSKTYEAGQLISIDRVVLRDIQVNQQTGKIVGAGPGWFATIRRNEQSSDFGGLPGQRTDSKKRSKPLVNLQITFQGELTGSTKTRLVEFHDQVAATYVPSEKWIEPTLQEAQRQLPEDAIEMECDKLSMEQATKTDGKWQSTIRATGNTRVFGDTFTAKAQQIKYVEAKDQLILEGQGRGNAELFYKPPDGAAETRAAARKILYWPKDKRALWNEGEYLEWNNLEAFLPPARSASASTTNATIPPRRSGGPKKVAVPSRLPK